MLTSLPEKFEVSTNCHGNFMLICFLAGFLLPGIWDKVGVTTEGWAIVTGHYERRTLSRRILT